MVDAVLAARLDALEQNLKHAEAATPKQWQKNLNLTNVRVEDAIWLNLEVTIGREVKRLSAELKKIRKKEDPKEAWEGYARAYEESEIIFRECLEFLGGLAFRDKLLDGKICMVADELIRSCAAETLEQPSLAIPAPQEALTKTLGRIIRLRFPERSVWTLPYIAHDFGHVIERMDKFVQAEVPRWAGQVKQPAEEYLRVLLADAFATYSMGPAYACAAILLRFNPSSAYTEHDKRPAVAKRAHVVLTMLREMDDQAGGGPYNAMIQHLEPEWRQMLERAGVSGTLEAEDKTRLHELVVAILEHFGTEFPETARYPHDGESGWLVAQKWQGVLWKHLGQDDPNADDFGEVSLTSKLRDVLNAAWLCRRKVSLGKDDSEQTKLDKIKQIGDEAHGLCEVIIEERQRGTVRTGRRRNSSKTRRGRQ